MSTSRRGDNVKKGQRYQNSWAYKAALHKTKKLDPSAVQLAGLCPRCREVIQWKMKYGKYKPLSAPKKCTLCGGRKVRLAYHHVCRECSGDKEVCGKCGKPAGGTETTQQTFSEHSNHEQPSESEEEEEYCR